MGIKQGDEFMRPRFHFHPDEPCLRDGWDAFLQDARAHGCTRWDLMPLWLAPLRIPLGKASTLGEAWDDGYHDEIRRIVRGFGEHQG